jgi:tetratricopeptide (TPR) repeat protein
MSRWTLVNVGVVLIAGAAFVAIRNTSAPPDPNDPNEVGVLQPTVMRRNLKHASDAANERVGKGQMSASEAKEKVSESAEQILKNLKIDQIPDKDLWEYGEVLWTAKEWETAIPVLEKAVQVATTEDRRINDSLRLAKCYAAVNKVNKALEIARSTLNAKPEDSAPLMLALTKELAPVAKGKGKDKELAQLIEDAIPVYQKTEVDQTTEEGKNFLLARPFHISEAWKLIAELRAKRA